MFVDSHAHVNNDRLLKDEAEVIAQAEAAGVQVIVNVGWDLPSSRAVEQAIASRGLLRWGFIPTMPRPTPKRLAPCAWQSIQGGGLGRDGPRLLLRQFSLISNDSCLSNSWNWLANWVFR